MRERVTITLEFRGMYKAYQLELDVQLVESGSVIGYVANEFRNIGADFGDAILSGDFSEEQSK